MILYRPMGLAETALVFEGAMHAFPPRLPGQPIFYPVLNAEYATQIARDWNTQSGDYSGYVARFEIADEFAAGFEIHTVGGGIHREMWVPAEELDALNSKIIGEVSLERAFFGQDFRGLIPANFGLKGADARQQIVKMIATMEYSMFDFLMEISANAPTFFLHFPFWICAGADRLGTNVDNLNKCLDAIRKAWSLSPRSAPLLEEASAV